MTTHINPAVYNHMSVPAVRVERSDDEFAVTLAEVGDPEYGQYVTAEVVAFLSREQLETLGEAIRQALEAAVPEPVEET